MTFLQAYKIACARIATDNSCDERFNPKTHRSCGRRLRSSTSRRILASAVNCSETWGVQALRRRLILPEAMRALFPRHPVCASTPAVLLPSRPASPMQRAWCEVTRRSRLSRRAKPVRRRDIEHFAPCHHLLSLADPSLRLFSALPLPSTLPLRSLFDCVHLL